MPIQPTRRVVELEYIIFPFPQKYIILKKVEIKIVSFIAILLVLLGFVYVLGSNVEYYGYLERPLCDPFPCYSLITTDGSIPGERSIGVCLSTNTKFFGGDESQAFSGRYALVKGKRYTGHFTVNSIEVL